MRSSSSVSPFRRFQNTGETVEKWVVHDEPKWFETEFPFSNMGMTIAIAGKGLERVIQMDDFQVRESDHSIELLNRLDIGFRSAQIVASGKNVTRIETNTDPRFVVDFVDHRRDLLKSAAHRCALSGSRFNSQRTFAIWQFRVDAIDRRRNAIDTGFESAARMRPGM